MPTGKSHVQSIIDGNTYNSGVDSNVCWHNRVRVSGSVETGYRNVKGSVGTANATSTTSKGLDLHQAILAVDAKLNSAWSAKVVARYGFQNYPIGLDFLQNPVLGAAWDIPEMFLTYSNPSHSPLFFKVGKGWLPFGHYADPYEILPTLTQSLSQLFSPETFAQLGVASAAGWNASVAGYTSDNTGEEGDWKWVANFGFQHNMRGVGLDMHASYLGKVAGAGPAWQVGVDTKLAGIDLGVDYWKAKDPTDPNPSLWGVHAGYGVHAAGYAHHFGVSYEKPKNIDVKNRFGLEYKVGLAKNVEAAVKYAKFSVDAATPADPSAWIVSLTGKF
jgi:hypothetical protein